VTEAQLFAWLGEELAADSESALTPIPLSHQGPDTGPYLKVQFVIELVGKEFIPGAAAKELIQPGTRAAFGDPEVYVMVPGQERWRALWTGDDALAYDSLAFAWDLVSLRGELSSGSARELYARAEKLALSMNRRAVPLRPLDDVDSAAANLRAVQESLDIGFDASVLPAIGAFETIAVIRAAYSLGYRLSASGLLEWRRQGWGEALLTLYPLGSPESFDPKRWPTVSGVGIGFSVACSPAPRETLERLFSTLDGMVARLGGVAADDEGAPLGDAERATLRGAMAAALRAFEQVGLEPGSPEALRLFEP
jgi:hypothetical protein